MELSKLKAKLKIKQKKTKCIWQPMGKMIRMKKKDGHLIYINSNSNSNFFLVRVWPYLDWMRENTDHKKLRIWTLFRQRLSWRRSLSYRNQQSKSRDCFLHDRTCFIKKLKIKQVGIKMMLFDTSLEKETLALKIDFVSITNTESMLMFLGNLYIVDVYFLSHNKCCYSFLMIPLGISNFHLFRINSSIRLSWILKILFRALSLNFLLNELINKYLTGS